jgi:hypothetical protein
MNKIIRSSGDIYSGRRISELKSGKFIGSNLIIFLIARPWANRSQYRSD